jgi:hypothetical protein
MRIRAILVALALCPPAFGAQLFVPRDFPTIQAAVDAATPGSTIVIKPGTYREELVIDKNLSLQGLRSFGRGVTVRSPATLTPFAIVHPFERELVAIVRIGKGARVSFSDLTVAGPIPCDPAGSGMMVTGGAHLRLREVRVTGIRPTLDCPSEKSTGNAIRMGAPPYVEMDGEFGTTGSLDARNILVDDFFGDGILGLGFGEERAEIRVVESIINGGPRRPGLFQAGIIVVANARAVLRDNAIGPIHCTDEVCGLLDLVNEGQSVGIGADSLSGDDHVVANNFIFGTDVGVWPGGGLTGISHNFIAAKLYGLLLQDGDYATDHNVIFGAEAGIVAYATGADTVVRSRGDFIGPKIPEPTKEIAPFDFAATVLRVR